MFNLLKIKHFFAVLLLLPCFAFAGQNSEHVAAYVQLWLKEHQVESAVDENDVLSITRSDLKIAGEVLMVDEKKENAFFVVETQLRVLLPDNRLIVENVIGVGESAEDAFMDSLLNLCTTTFHPVYAEFIDPKDSHVGLREVEFSGGKRTVYFADWGLRGDNIADAELDKLWDEVLAVLQTVQFDEKTHWGKLTALSMDGKLSSLELDLDNESDEETGEKLMGIYWPPSDNFYMLKRFFIVSQER